MTSWVRVSMGSIIEGPIGLDTQPDGFIEYVEVINLPPYHGPVSVTIAVVDGKCVKTITATTSYSAQRQAAYPDMGNQLDMFWHAMDSNVIPRVEPFYSEIKAVKDQYPKPS